MTRDAWVAGHPYLQPIADVRAEIEDAAHRVSAPVATLPDWPAYLDDFHLGVPLLHSERAAVDVPDPSSVVSRMLEELGRRTLPAWLEAECRDLGANLQPQHALFRCLLWAVLARDLEAVLAAFATWRDEERWLRNYCPACGAAPAMAQLAGRGEGRLRLLSCGYCATRWRYRRTGCPFCEPVDDHRLAVLAIQGESGLRIDYCEKCHGYLKTYDGEGIERVLLADWTSLHLDVVARERGLTRKAASLYDL